jgi:hypothetical protein
MERRLLVLLCIAGALLVIGGISWLVRGCGSGHDERVARGRPVVCTECKYEEPKFDAPYKNVNWPKECPKCGKKTLVPGTPCPHCKKITPVVDATTANSTKCLHCDQPIWLGPPPVSGAGPQ